MTYDQLFLSYALLTDTARLTLPPAAVSEITRLRARLAPAIRHYRALSDDDRGALDTATAIADDVAPVTMTVATFDAIVTAAVTTGPGIILTTAFATGTADRDTWLETIAENFLT